MDSIMETNENQRKSPENPAISGRSERPGRAAPSEGFKGRA